jgi:hypothetical protein
MNDLETLPREAWWRLLHKVSGPVLRAGAQRTLRASMPVEIAPEGDASRNTCSHLEAVGRTLSGLAPWLSHAPEDAAERQVWQECRDQVRLLLASGLDPDSPDAFDMRPHQALVDAAFLAQAILRLGDSADELLGGDPGRKALCACLRKSLVHAPPQNNWLLFVASVETLLHRSGEGWSAERVSYGLDRHEAWYKGDGVYGDGPDFHWDYYNSYVIQPMLLEILEAFRGVNADWDARWERTLARAKRYADVQERFVGPDGSFPPLGRSLPYRCGAFQHLAFMAWRGWLPPTLENGQVRSALGAVIQRTLTPPETFDAGGWLRLGLAGHQPHLAESYISTGSLYLCTQAFLPLGLPASHPFWTSAPKAWTAQRAWGGQDLPRDQALKG